MGTQSTWGLYCGLTMHYLLLALSFFVASAQVIPTCDECKAAVDGLVTRLTSDASIDEQTTILISMLCPAVPDPQQCEDGLTVAWPEIGRAVYPKFLESTSVCTQQGSCTLREWTCEACLDGIIRIAGIINDPATIAEVTAFVQGDGFCGQHPENAECPDQMSLLIPDALPILADVMIETDTELCQDIVGVC